MSKKVRKLKVLCLYLNGINNKVFKNGDICLETQISGRNVDQLIKSKAVEVVDGNADDGKDPVFVTEDGKDVFKSSDCSKSDIITELEKRKIEFEEKETKGDLFSKLLK